MSTASEGALAPAPLQDGAEFMTAFATRELSDPAVAIVLAVAILSVYCLLRCTICRPKKENEEDLAAEWWRSSGGVSIPYEPEEHVVATMARWRGTALEMIFRKPMYYALIGSHVLLRYYDETISGEAASARLDCPRGPSRFAPHLFGGLLWGQLLQPLLRAVGALVRNRLPRLLLDPPGWVHLLAAGDVRRQAGRDRQGSRP